MDKKKFVSVIYNHDLAQAILDDGLIESENKNSEGKQAFIIGIDISYDTVDYHKYNKFTLLLLNEFQIVSTYRNLFGVSLLNKRLNNKTSNGNLLFEIIKRFRKESDIESDNPVPIINNIIKWFNVRKLPIFDTQKVLEIIEHPVIEQKYIHIDYGLGIDLN